MSLQIQVYKLVTPFGSSLHETDEEGGKIFYPSSIRNRCIIWSLLGTNVQVYRLVGGKWVQIFNWPASKLRR